MLESLIVTCVDIAFFRLSRYYSCLLLLMMIVMMTMLIIPTVVIESEI